MKLSKRSWIALAIGVLFIISGVLEASGKLNLSPAVKKNADMVLMILAFALLFSGRKKNTENKDNSTEQNTQQITNQTADQSIDQNTDINNENTSDNKDNK